MLLSWLSKVLAALLVSALTGAVFTMVFNQTVLNSKYLEHQLATTDSYSRLSVALNDQVIKSANSADTPVDPTMVEKLKSILTPTLLQSKINASLDQMQVYYRGMGPVPTVNLTDVAAQAQAAGVPVPANSDINKPISLGANKQARGISKSFDQVRTGTLISSLVLMAGLLAVSWERHKWAVLPDVLITAGVLLGLVALIFAVVSGASNHYIKLDTTSNSVEPIVRDLATSITRDLARRLGMTASLFIAAGVGSRVLVGRLHPKATAFLKPSVKPIA